MACCSYRGDIAHPVAVRVLAQRVSRASLGERTASSASAPLNARCSALSRPALRGRPQVSCAAAAAPSGGVGVRTLTSWLLAQERVGLDRELATLLDSVASACRRISSLVARAPLDGMVGLAAASNASGDEQKKLDVIANDVFAGAVCDSGRCNILVSEEEEQPVLVSSTGSYIACFDPIDGSSNIDAAVPTGSIFGIYSLGECIVDEDVDSAAEVLDKCLVNVRQSGNELAAAGYCLFSSSTVLVLTVKSGVFGFTLDRTRGEFILSHDAVRIPDPGQRIVSGNLGNLLRWSPPLRTYFQSVLCAEPNPYSYRYIGALVGDFHRTLLYGGLWLYPPDATAPQGKARLLYEVAPMALLAEQAGGMATWGEGAQLRVLDVVPKSTHERCPLFVGSASEVIRLQQYLAAARA